MDDKKLTELAKQHQAITEINVALRPDILDFIRDVGIQHSETQVVDVKYIHWAYVKWCGLHGKRPVDPRIFGKEFKKVFKRSKTRNTGFYYINKDVVQLDELETLMMRKYYRDKDERKKTSSKKRQVSRIKKTL